MKHSPGEWQQAWHGRAHEPEQPEQPEQHVVFTHAA